MIIGIIMYLLVSLIVGLMVSFHYYLMLLYGAMIVVLVLLLMNYRFRGVMVSLYFIDGISLNLILLRVWVRLLMILRSYGVIERKMNCCFFVRLIFFLMFTLFITFVIVDLLYFYFFFEVSLIPTLIIIMGWGYQPERIQAGIYFMFYTLTASLPLLFILVNLMGDLSVLGGLVNIYVSMSFVDSLMGGVIIYFILMMAFLVKLPMYFTHLWLPKAHVEAPVAGSIILAGVLLKLGGYGLMRVMPLVYKVIFKPSRYFVGLRLIGMVYVGGLCCRLNDFKALVAYSSVAHIAIVIRGCMAVNYWGYIGSFIIMLSHGLSSSGLFCIVNIFYERFGSRRFYVNRGLILVFPLLSLIMFMLVAANISAPPTINLLSEIFLMVGIMGYDVMIVLVFPIGSFLGAVFSIFMYSFRQHGRMYGNSLSFIIVRFRELHCLFLHVLPVNFIILGSFLFMSING